MKRIFVQLTVSLMAILLCASGTWAVNTVVVESAALSPGQTGVEVKIKLENDVILRNVGVPVAVRTVQGSAFITTLKCAWGDRLVNDPSYPLSAIVFLNTYVNEDGTCKDALPGGFGTISYTDTLAHAVSSSPIGVLFERAKIFGGQLPPGADAVGSLRMIFDVTSTQGVFEIDSTCTNPANHPLYIEDVTNVGITPDFTKGVFTVGHPPVARDTAWSTNENTAHAVSYLPASDPDGDPLQFSITAGPAHGSITGFVPGSGAFLYTPDPLYNGPDSLSFVATDGGFVSNTGKVRISVIHINTPPVARDTSIVTDEDTPVNAQLQAYDIDSPTLTYTRLTGPSHGSITAFSAATGAFTYLPNLNYNGSDAMTFRANDGIANSNPATVSITVNPVNDPPVARDTSITVPYETPVTTKFLASDVDGPSITFAKVSGPSNGTFSGFNATTGAFTYTPNTGYFGPDSIKFTADDGSGPGNVGTIRFSVSSSNCVCACWSDPQCNGQTNVIDLVRVIQILFENHAATISPQCPTLDADFNCDCFIDVLDLGKIIDILFRGDTTICNPCSASCGHP